MGGETFGNYEVIATLGRGGMGVVYLAQHHSIARRVAVKVLVPELTKDPAIVRRFFLEAKAISLIHHPGIVEVFDYDIDASGRAYIVMEYLEGETLAACLQRVPMLPWQTASAVASRIASAVGAAHAHGIVHRDLKPGNVFLSSVHASSPAMERRVKILDFGLAKLLFDETPAEPITRAGVLLGTPTYISPEQCSAANEVNEGTDVYALGCILYEMICGQPPFEREGFRALLAAHMFDPPPRASARVPAIPAWLDELIARMLAKQAADRPQSMPEIADALSAAGNEEAGLTLLLPSEASAPLARGTRRFPVALPSGARRRIRFAGTIGGLAALLAVGAFAISRVVRTRDRPSARAFEPAALEIAVPVAVPVLGRAPPAAVAEHREEQPLAAAPAGGEPDAESPSRLAPTEPRSPTRRRNSEAPPRRRAEAPRGGAPQEINGIVDL